MGSVLNAEEKLYLFETSYRNKYFVDKSQILARLNALVRTEHRYICITRPRRFGKTVMTNLLSSYYAKELDSRKIFDTLKIAKEPTYQEHLNKHNVISLNMSKIPEMCDSYEKYIIFHINRIKKDLMEYFSEVSLSEEMGLAEMFSEIFRKTKEGFIFIIDEWDSYFHSDFFTEKGGAEYLRFLCNLLKDQAYVELAYITGIMTIRKYSSGSEMNMFREFHFPTDSIYDTYFGFTEEEVMELCERNKKMEVPFRMKNLWNGTMGIMHMTENVYITHALWTML